MNKKLIGYAALFIGIGLLPLLGAYPVFVMKVLCYALFACAFNLLIGFTGLLSFGHAAFFGSAGYVTGHLLAVVGLPTELGIVLGVAASFAAPFPLFLDDRVPVYSAAAIGGVLAVYALGGIPVSLLYSVAEGLDRIRRPRFAWALAIGLESGLTFAGAARMAATASGMSGVGRHLDGVPPKALKTMTLTQMLERSGVWPAMLERVRSADESSEYLSTLRVFAEHLESPP